VFIYDFIDLNDSSLSLFYGERLFISIGDTMAFLFLSSILEHILNTNESFFGLYPNVARKKCLQTLTFFPSRFLNEYFKDQFLFISSPLPLLRLTFCLM